MLTAQRSASGRMIRSISVMEGPVEDFVRRDELVLTIAAELWGHPKQFLSFTREVRDAGATALAISIGAIPSYARIMRATVLTIKDQEYVEAARATGASDLRIILKHIVPNTLSPIIVESTLRIGACIMQISSLSFIGLGVTPPTPEWGSIMSAGREYLRDFYPIVTFPGIAIMVTLFGFNLVGDGLRDALDPRLKR